MRVDYSDAYLCAGTAMDADVFYQTLQHKKYINDWNAYWDKVFGYTSQSWLERCRLSDKDTGIEEEYYEDLYEDFGKEEWFFEEDDTDFADEDFEDYDD